MLKNVRKINVQQVVVDRDKRQRREVQNVDDLIDSIKRLGVLQPIVLDVDGKLIAGERRLTACRAIDPDYLIPYIHYDSLDEQQKQLVELDENIRRVNLPWKDQAFAVYKLHQLLLSMKLSTSLEATADYCGMSPVHLARYISVAQALLDGDIRVENAEGIIAAANILRRDAERKQSNEMNELLDAISSSPIPKTHVEFPQEDSEPEIKPVVKIAETKPTADIVCENFIEWAENYEGKKFNLLHCDFPYGVNHGNSAQGGTANSRWEGYDDSPDVYWELCKALCSNLDKILYPSAHVIFWFSMEYYVDTLAFFQKHAPSLDIQAHPFVWHKTDNKGIVKDVERRPRNVYETALIMSRGDRKIIQPIANCYGAPTRKEIHVSEKPEPVLRHLFRMFADHYTEMLDPTAGSGTAVRVASCDFGAKRALGLELNPDFAEQAATALRRRLAMEAVSGQLKIGVEKETTDA